MRTTEQKHGYEIAPSASGTNHPYEEQVYDYVAEKNVHLTGVGLERTT
jgi:hypothetical protein